MSTLAIMSILLKIPFSLFVLIGISSCSSYPETPEAVVEEFSTLLSEGNCEEAMTFAIAHAKETVKGSIDAGCETYDSKIDSIDCIIREDKSQCLCYEKRMEMEMVFPYELEFIEGEWLISYMAKDGAYWFSESDSLGME